MTPEQIKKIRSSAGMTTKELSEYLGCSRVHVWRMEMDRSKDSARCPSGPITKLLEALLEKTS